MHEVEIKRWGKKELRGHQSTRNKPGDDRRSRANEVDAGQVWKQSREIKQMMQEWCYDRKPSENTILRTITWQNCQWQWLTQSDTTFSPNPNTVCYGKKNSLLFSVSCDWVTSGHHGPVWKLHTASLWNLSSSSWGSRRLCFGSRGEVCARLSHTFDKCLFIQMDFAYKCIFVWMLGQKSLNSPAEQSAGQRVKLWNKLRSAWFWDTFL